ncbi:MAG: methylated-DNA--[protein]-cysteine S-methyltransferase [Actinobacteria bacterium]|nr:methylated-DNA--[protein]-cysteine S-methyltransferase [Actinomycetota bacterium]
MPSPVGRLLLVGDGEVLSMLHMQDPAEPVAIEDGWTKDESSFIQARSQLSAYFEGELTRFDLELRPEGTVFQKKVWDALLSIPFGRTASYLDIAVAAGSPRACRAVGAANSRNPIAIVVPCHRVIGKSGKLVGYSGGLDRKEKLLSFEAGVLALAGAL